MATISSSVGHGGRNVHADVVTVQKLLNQHAAAVGLAPLLVADGLVGTKTIGAIVLFQRKVVGMLNPDGRVDPGGGTLRALNGSPASGATGAGRRPRFILLWGSYPTVSDPCEQGWTNQCAIRMSIALNTERTITVSASSYSEPRCQHGHARGAQSLATWLWSRHLGRPRIFSDTAAAKHTLGSEQGIVFFKDCFTRAGQSTRSGDHIDLWLRGLTKTYDDPGNHSAQLWFWELT